jgi:hypothetical protein
MLSRDALLAAITDCYLKSSDYNGISASFFLKRHEPSQVRDAVAELLQDGLLSIVFGDYHPNPHIKALPSESVEEQLQKLRTEKFDLSCIYPTPKHLRSVVDASVFQGRPFELCLALGEPQLLHKSFDLDVLEIYRNDPRYNYSCDDIHGHISIRSDFFETGRIRESDQVLLESFGFSFDSAINIYVAAFLRYLSCLSPEHQQIWASKQIAEETVLHPDYFRTSIIGHFPERLSLYETVLLEMKTANEISAAMGRSPIFKEDFRENCRPQEFGYLLRPTLKEFNGFVHLLDKMLSENIDRDFFHDDVPFETEEERGDGKTIVRQKGTIQILGDWLAAQFKTDDPSPITELLQTLRKIRELRQKPAHAIKENEFDQKYIHQQRALMKSVYRAVKILRLILHCHPAARSIEIDSQLEKGLIWSY